VGKAFRANDHDFLHYVVVPRRPSAFVIIDVASASGWFTCRLSLDVALRDAADHVGILVYEYCHPVRVDEVWI
jgi:hypothetical protein